MEGFLGWKGLVRLGWLRSAECLDTILGIQKMGYLSDDQQQHPERHSSFRNFVEVSLSYSGADKPASTILLLAVLCTMSLHCVQATAYLCFAQLILTPRNTTLPSSKFIPRVYVYLLSENLLGLCRFIISILEEMLLAALGLKTVHFLRDDISFVPCSMLLRRVKGTRL